MRVRNISNINFQRRLTKNEEVEFSAVLKQGKEKVGNTGHSMLIVPSASLPQKINTGVGNLLDEESGKFFDFAKQYWGINYVQLLPEGRYKTFGRDCVLPYSGSAFDLGPQMININLLTQKEFGNLLNKDDIKYIESNVNYSTNNKVQFENVILKNSPHENMLRKAYTELVKADTPEKIQLLNEIEIFKEANKDWLEPKSIYEALSAKYQSRDTRTWSKFDHNLYNTDFVSIERRIATIKKIRESNLGNEAKFYEFKQFLAENHLARAKSELNKKGLKLSGDMLAGFSFDEVWANPKAFIKDCSIGWGIPAINFETPEGEALIRRKVRNFAKRYDGIRLDASWAYITQPIHNYVTGEKTKKEYESMILDIIDDEIKRIKGKDFNLENIMHEFVANPRDFNLFDGTELRLLGKDRVKIYTSHNLTGNWATTTAFKDKGWKNGSYILGATNHDSYPLRKEFKNTKKCLGQKNVLSRILKIPRENLESYQGFIQAKFAEPMRSKHNMLFFTEALNLLDRYKDNEHLKDDYKVKIPKNYQEEYFKSLEKGEGFNVMDALEKAFVAEGLNEKEPKLYKKIVKYKNILKSSKENSNLFSNRFVKWGVFLSTFILIGIITQSLINNKKKAE